MVVPGPAALSRTRILIIDRVVCAASKFPWIVTAPAITVTPSNYSIGAGEIIFTVAARAVTP